MTEIYLHIVARMATDTQLFVKVCSATVDTTSIAPNCYVLYQWYNQQVTTHTIRGGAGQPSWHHSRMCSLPVDVLQVRFHIIRNARIENVGKSQSCMVLFCRGCSPGSTRSTKCSSFGCTTSVK